MLEPIAIILLTVMLVAFLIYLGVSVWRQGRKS
jgi:threonine/homoserine/homoserine lactone efflux protein